MSIFLFHRDFRTIDNTTLLELSKKSDCIYPVFIFNPEQVDSEKNPYYNEKSIQFMTECLPFPIQVFYGDTLKVLESLFKENEIEYIGFNLDYTAYAIERTKNVKKLSEKYNVKVITNEDYTLMKMTEFREKGFYKVFRPFYEHLLTLDIPKPSKRNIHLSEKKLKVKKLYEFKLPKNHQNHRKDALRIMKNTFSNYEKTRNIPHLDSTTHLSKYIKYGVVSIREVYDVYKNNIELARQIIWHDFYASLMYFLPKNDTIGGGNLQHKSIKWQTKYFKQWCKGETGIPLVDAGMRQLNESGWMHNRVRLITSNFLSMVLKIDWKKGEKYFAQKLIDYDVASNNLNWQFSAQVGTDRNPYVRIYNPFLQSLKYDKDCDYIKRWIPELKNVECKDIHKWYKMYEKYDTYVKPIVKY